MIDTCVSVLLIISGLVTTLNFELLTNKFNYQILIVRYFPKVHESIWSNSPKQLVKYCDFVGCYENAFSDNVLCDTEL